MKKKMETTGIMGIIWGLYRDYIGVIWILQQEFRASSLKFRV